MNNFRNELLDCLMEMKGSGNFSSFDSLAFTFPRLFVENLGELSFPINAIQVKALIQVAHKAPFGKGAETIIDETVRSAWEINPELLSFNGEEWNRLLKKIISNIQNELGLQDAEIEAHLYKMLIYEKGDFFLSHRDTEKEKGMFGTLIIGLPTIHEGGELLIRFDGEEKIVNFAEETNKYRIPYVAFYADCEHEVKPVKEGYRVCLVYNLVQKEGRKPIQAEALSSQIEKLTTILEKHSESEKLAPGVVLLGHQYTPENFSIEQLKLDDRPRAVALIRAAESAGFYANLCLVTSYQSGQPSYDGYDWDETPNEDVEMEEVYDDSISITNWAKEGIPPIYVNNLEEEDLITTIKINNGDPIEKEIEGYMGNYGPDLTHWYHYGAVAFWPKKEHQELLLSQNFENQLRWVNYYNSQRKALSREEIATCEHILSTFKETDFRSDKIDFQIIVNWLIGYQDESSFSKLGNRVLTHYFKKINPESWIKLLDAYSFAPIQNIFGSIAKENDLSKLWHLISILHSFLNHEKGQKLIEKILPDFPVYFSSFSSEKNKRALVSTEILNNLIDLELFSPQNSEWRAELVTLFTSVKDRIYINKTISEILLKPDPNSVFARQLSKILKEDLENRVNQKPQPPKDWKRPLPEVKGRVKSEFEILKEFMDSPTVQIFDYKRLQAERIELENLINRSGLDLRTETIRKGSPYTLRIIKTQATFQRLMNEWHEDVALLEKIKKSSY